MSTATSDDQPPDDRETASCTKCKSEIPIEAERCPECGFEPRVGILGGIGVWVSLMLGSTFAVIALSSLIVIADGFPVRDGLIVAGITGFIALFFFGYIYNKWQTHKSKPAQPTQESDGDGNSKSFRESWEEGKERGEDWKAKMDVAPDWVFNAVVLTGCMLSLSVWGVALLEFETALLISLLLGMLGLYLAVTLDVKRTNRVYGSGYRWYAYGIPAAIPLIGWVFGIVWLYRKRGTTRAGAGTDAS